jgi:hypothetical protein
LPRIRICLSATETPTRSMLARFAPAYKASMKRRERMATSKARAAIASLSCDGNPKRVVSLWLVVRSNWDPSFSIAAEFQGHTVPLSQRPTIYLLEPSGWQPFVIVALSSSTRR